MSSYICEDITQASLHKVLRKCITAFLTLSIGIIMLRILWCNYQERRDKTQKQWIRIGRRQVLRELAKLDGHELREELKKMCTEEGVAFPIRKEVEDEESGYESSEEGEESGYEGEDEEEASEYEGEGEDYDDSGVQEWLDSLPEDDMKPGDWDGETEVASSSYPVLYYDTDTPSEASSDSTLGYISATPPETSTHDSLDVGTGGFIYDSLNDSSDHNSEGIVVRRQREWQLMERALLEVMAQLQEVRALRERHNELIERGDEWAQTASTGSCGTNCDHGEVSSAIPMQTADSN